MRFWVYSVNPPVAARMTFALHARFGWLFVDAHLVAHACSLSSSYQFVEYYTTCLFDRTHAGDTVIQGRFHATVASLDSSYAMNEWSVITQPFVLIPRRAKRTLDYLSSIQPAIPLD